MYLYLVTSHAFGPKKVHYHVHKVVIFRINVVICLTQLRHVQPIMLMMQLRGAKESNI